MAKACLALFAIALVGCGGGSGAGSTPSQIDAKAVRARSDMYSHYMATHKFQPPKDEAEFRKFLASEQSQLDQAGLTVDEMFVSPRGGQPMTWVFAQRPKAAGGINVYGYEKNSVDGQRLLIGDRGMYVMMADAEFQRAFPDAQK